MGKGLGVKSVLEEKGKAPDFSLQDEAGRTVKLSDFKGQTVVLYFYPKDDTPGCTTEACGFRDEASAFKKKGVQILGMSPDPVAAHQKFKKKYGLNFPLLSDPEKTALDAYGVWQEKSMYGRKYMGVVRTTVIIDPKGKIAKVFPKVSVTGHTDAVLEAVDALHG